MNDSTVIASGNVPGSITDEMVEAAQAVIAALAPYNMELRFDGSEDKQAAAYVQGVEAAHGSVRAALEAALGVQS